MRRAVIALILCLTATGVAHAQSLEDRLRSQLVAVNGRLQELQNGQSALVAQKAAAEAERDTFKRRLAASEAQVRAAKRGASGPELAQYKAQVDQAVQAKAQGDVDLASARAEVARLTRQVQQDQAERERLSTLVVQAQSGAEAARAKNAQALAVAREVLDAYSRVSVADVVARREPFIGLKRVQIEKLEQDYGDRLYGARLDVPAQAASQTVSKPQ
jgi:DNA repair exonuclease SbcCD ATPase subunit